MNKEQWLKQIEFCKKILSLDHIDNDYMLLIDDSLTSGDYVAEINIPIDITKYYEVEITTKKVNHYINPIMDYIQIYDNNGKQETIKISKLKFDSELKEMLSSDN